MTTQTQEKSAATFTRTQYFRFYKKSDYGVYPRPYVEYSEHDLLKMEDRQPIYYPNDKIWPNGKIAPKDVKSSLHEFVKSTLTGKLFQTELGTFYYHRAEITDLVIN